MNTVRYIGTAGETVRDDAVEGDLAHALKHADLNRPVGAIEQRIYDASGRFVIRETITGGQYSADGPPINLT